ncbi:AlbA family DNA-binding domain-containing protein [Bordetella bronchiseptica]|uniref:AlbA family DNA-binding domain-containing protein n=1 Tax=Bordetella bronchiseptica TaxID=518 RepID=UPI001247E391|nr:ATP-binding protein [Bordetella bronchiseptica]KAB1448550.1 ATP-binding protein [Bordetella bronchiseptica]KAB1574872.1 ATP-binding protein [Bordetella bronchiseptica]
MSIDRTNFEAVTESDLVELVEGQVPEGLQLEYKAIVYENDERGRSEAVKDISAFANAHGGHLILGMSEKPKGLPSRLNGLAKDVDIDTEIRRLESLAQTGIEPRIEGLRIRAIRLQGGQHCIVLRIPRSWRPPHRVTRGNLNQFWIRNSAGAHEASVDELRSLFTLGTGAQQLAAQFRDTRLQEFSQEVSEGGTPRKDHGIAVLHLVPLASVTTPWSVDLGKAATELRENFRALAHDGRGPRFALDGMVVNGMDRGSQGQTLLFRDGKLEATLRNIVFHEFDNTIDAKTFEETILTAVPQYLAGIQSLDIPSPVAVFLTLVDVKHAAYGIGKPVQNAPRIGRPVAVLPPCLIETYGAEADYSRALQPAFDALWNTANRARAESFSEDGVWLIDNFKPFRD